MMGELEFFIKFEVKQLREGIFINQAKYTQDMIKRFKMVDAKPIKTPTQTNVNISLEPNGKVVGQKVYSSMIGSLVYLCVSRQKSLCAQVLRNIYYLNSDFIKVNLPKDRIKNLASYLSRTTSS